MTTSPPRCRDLVLDAGPLLSLSPLRGLAETYLTVPQVFDELKDQRAREHFERLGLNAGVKIEVREADKESLAHVIQWAKKTGDYAVLSYADLCILALTYSLHVRSEEENSEKETSDTCRDNGDLQSPPTIQPDQPAPPLDLALYDDPSDSDDGEGEWITPSNVAIHKSRALDFLPTTSDKGKGVEETVRTGCMTADFAMQNVLLQMGLNLVNVDGKRIKKVKTWVLRCHACFKICKDNTKKFCPSCGNPTLLRASVTIASPDASASTPAMQVHLKPNFQYRTRGTIYSIPAPKPGSAKHGHGEGLILREDQAEYMRAKKLADGKTEREEKKMMKGMMGRGGIEGGVKTGSWMDPDWIPEIMTTGAGRKGRIGGGGKSDGMPVIGYGKKNPNEKRRKK